jgi:hypothetical protein
MLNIRSPPGRHPLLLHGTDGSTMSITCDPHHTNTNLFRGTYHMVMIIWWSQQYYQCKLEPRAVDFAPQFALRSEEVSAAAHADGAADNPLTPALKK